MKKRTLKVLLQLVVDYIPTEINFCGLCATVSEMYYKELSVIHSDEKHRLNLWLNVNKPKHGKFYSVSHDDLDYWWAAGEKQPRIDFLNHKISQL